MEKEEFELAEYIRKRMMEISQLEERSLFRKVVEKALLKVHEYNQQAYQRLEERVLEECRSSRNQYAISLTLTKVKDYDATDSFLQPMCPEDIRREELSCQKIQKQLDCGEAVRLYTVFIKVSASGLQELCKEEKRYFNGTIKTHNREYPARFCLKKNEKYLKLIEELYSVFLNGGQPWVTVCTAYLHKLFDLYLVQSEEMKQEERILEISPVLEEYEDRVEYDVIPLWNMQTIREKSSTYPEPCIDKVNYEHQIFSQRLNPKCQYLVRNKDVEITEIRRFKGDLFITCPEEKPWEWQLYQIYPYREKNSHSYPVLSNKIKDSFLADMMEMHRAGIKTKGEIARLTEAFSFEDYLQFQDVFLCDSLPGECIPGNYNMDDFLVDEFRTGQQGQAMIIEFKAVDETNYLNEDIMSFLVTQIQKIFPQFRCVGRLTWGFTTKVLNSYVEIKEVSRDEFSMGHGT